jgi:GAF domain-containing protein
MASPVPENEPARLRSLRLFQIMDSGAERAFDELARLASIICETPVSLITLLDEKRQWFKAGVGVSITETPREYAFCAHAVLSPELMIVPDARLDARFQDNPLVVSDPSIRFYAGAPLVVSDGSALGTLCVLDRMPRVLTEVQTRALLVLRDAVVTQLELRRATQDLQALEQLVPICAWCRSVHRDDGSWSPLYDYVAERKQVTHGMCPDCAAILVSEAKATTPIATPRA